MSSSNKDTVTEVSLNSQDFNKKNASKKAFLEQTIANPLLYDAIGSPVIPRETYIPFINVTCILYHADHLNIIIQDAEKPRWELPLQEPCPFVKDPKYLDIEDSNFELEITQSPFNVIIRRRSTDEVIFKLMDRLVYTDLYIEFTFLTPTNNLYGFGERVAPLQYKSGTYTLFIFDRSGEIDPGRPGFNQQGHHPMYLTREQSGFYHVTFFKNTNAQKLTLTQDQKIIWKTIGGVIDLSFFLGEDPESVIARYHQDLGG